MGVLSILQDSVFLSAVAPRSLFRFGDGRECVEDDLEDLCFRLDIRQLFYAPNITFRTLHSSQANNNYGLNFYHQRSIRKKPLNIKHCYYKLNSVILE